MLFPGHFLSPCFFRYRWLTTLLLLLIAIPVMTMESLIIGEQTLQHMETQYGSQARKRLLAWQTLMQKRTGSTMDQLERVNRFFNDMRFIDDIIHWNKVDYWATPIEFLASHGGDCEDFAIAKYFTLIQLGIPEEQLTLTYVKALRLNRAHMVLTYYPSPGAIPLVLDNLNPAILPSTKRPDLLPVYSLNGSGLWLAKQRGRGKKVDHSGRLQRWQEMMDRLTDQTQQDKETP